MSELLQQTLNGLPDQIDRRLLTEPLDIYIGGGSCCPSLATVLPIYPMLPAPGDIANANIREYSGLFFVSFVETDAELEENIKNNNPDIARVQAEKAFSVAIGAPVWFAPAMAIALRPLKDCLQATKDHVERDLGAVKSQGSYNATGAGSE
ncbi:hypothetical protein M378DRAFT_27021 [Amanita muscaria Koide BX008]|uniref:Uncharacterized protein n=1 Tax=Amanita muscaria (strain Koide BX008) TaxID=946122 RepID=A0A0C2WDI4_AMAMK|nr:hypothetical protein M378DRAFT_27021 [Amanita muscaria Koide BX008]